MKFKKILVTGGAGCIGIKVCNELMERGCEVVLYDMAEQIEVSQNSLSKELQIFPGSIMDRTSLRDAISGCDGLIHLAAHLGVSRTEANKLRCLEINIDGTKNVLDAVSRSDSVSKFIFASSSEVYGEPLKNPISEDDTTQGKTLYAVSKLAGEELVKAYNYEFGNFDYTILRYFNTYGPNQVAQFVIPKFIYRVQNGLEPVINGDGSQTRSYNFSSDTARATVDCLFAAEANSLTMNIGNSREPISLKDLASLIIKILGKEDEISPKIDKKFLSTDRVSEREINNRFCDSSLAEKIIGYESLVTLEEGIRKVIDSKSISPDWMTKEKGYLVD
tara:strand:+ start:4952 stop:5950 length:999 start_codon:yes stop_codon:yes gene_type:complete